MGNNDSSNSCTECLTHVDFPSVCHGCNNYYVCHKCEEKERSSQCCLIGGGEDYIFLCYNCYEERVYGTKRAKSG